MTVKSNLSLLLSFEEFRKKLCLQMDRTHLEPVLINHNLVAFITNESWVLVRRREYIDAYIDNQPYNSVQVLFHILIKVSDCLLNVFKMCFKCRTHTKLSDCFRGSSFECGAKQLLIKLMLV